MLLFRCLSNFRGVTADMGEEIDEQELEAHYSYMAKIQEQPESTSNTCLVKKDDSNVTLNSPDICDNDIQTDQNAEDERATLANLIANLKLDVDENKKIQKQLKKANASLAHELNECKSILAETSKTLGESNSIWDSCLIALQNKQTKFERYKALNDRIVDYDKLKLVKEKHDELVKHSILTKSHYEGRVKEKTNVITYLKFKEEKDIDKMISMENQLKFLNEIVYKRSQSIQTIHMLAPKCPTFNGRPTIANPMYLKKAQYEKPCLYAIPHNQSDPANRFIPDREEILTLEEESRSKQTEFERYKAFNDRTVDYDKLERKLNETLGLLAQKEIDIKEGLKVKAYEIYVVKEKHDDLVKQSFLTKSHYEGLIKEKKK
ncbi:hypothetical protein Tco_0919954 [Tanacetum coccineum]